MDNPEQHGIKPLKGGTSGQKTDGNAVSMTKNGLRRDDNRKAGTGGQTHGNVPDPGRSSREDGSATTSRQKNNSSDFEGQKKRARRRKLGKALGKTGNKSNSAAAEPQKRVARGQKHSSAIADHSINDRKNDNDSDTDKQKSKRKRRARRGRHFARVAAENLAANKRAQLNADTAKNGHVNNADTEISAESLQVNGHRAEFKDSGFQGSFGFRGAQQNHSQLRPKNSPRSAQIAEQVSNIPAGKPFTPRSYPANNMPLYAALDLGTNNCRLLIAAPTRPGQFKVVDAYSRIVRLGEGLSSTGCLSEQAMDRAIEALKICQDKLTSRTIRRSRLIATEACRAATNGEHFLQRVRDEAGLELEIVDRQTEARLAVSGCGTLVAHDTEAIVLFDIGGGSSEIALIDVSKRRSPRLAEHIIAWTSLPVGVVTLAERFDGRNVTSDSFTAMVDHVSSMISDFSERHQLGNLAKGTRFHLLGTSGTVTTLAGIHLGLERYDRRRVDGMWMGTEDVTRMTQKLLSWDFDARVANPCIGSDRADLVLAGCAILDAIRNVWPSEKLLVADRGLREGILTELMSRDGVWRHQRNHTHYKYRQNV